MTEEGLIKKQITDRLRLCGWLVLRMQGGKVRHNVVMQLPGMPDLECISPDGRIVWIEVKTHDGVVSPDQLAMHEDLEMRNQEVLIARSVEDIEELVDV